MKYPVLLVMASLSACAIASQTAQEQARADLNDLEGAAAGSATLRDTPNGVLVRLKVTNLPEGTYAMHIHETGRCEPPFESANGHFNPGSDEHGFMNPAGAHAGDLPNITVPASRTLELEVLVPGVTLAAGERSLFDSDGSALMIHRDADDYRTDPDGNAGDRIVCGIIRR